MKTLITCLLLITGFSTINAQVNLSLGLKAHYTFDGNVNDQSGNNNNPIFNNTSFTTDRQGNANSAVSFNGTNTYIQIPNAASLNFTNQISICVWVKPLGFYQGTCHGNSIVMKGNSDNLPGNYLLRFDDNFFTNGTNCSNPVVDVDHQNFYGRGTNPGPPGYTPYIQPGQWYSVIYTYDGSTARLYVNCELKVSTPAPGLTFTNSAALFLGKLNNATYPYWLNGDLDDVRIYDRAINVEEVNVLGGCSTLIGCQDWLNTPSAGSSVKVGDLDITGNQITVECLFNRTSPWSGNYLYAGDLVSKHSLPSDVNYLLRPNNAEITTTNGYYSTPPVCLIELNKTYHAALVYDGSQLKFYRNGYLLSQVAATGNLVTNDLITTIGDYAFNNPIGTNFQGVINEVRIWNIARTQQDLNTYMSTYLPNPSTQMGLLGYYSFNSLLNQQGNAAWNGILNGAGTINASNPNCLLIPDSCQRPAVLSNIINSYTPVLSYIPCNNSIQVEDASEFGIGDTVLIIQMKGADIDSTNTAQFGDVININSAGNYEFNYISQRNGNILSLSNRLERTYDIPIGKVQLVRVPYYNSALVTDTLTCLPWDGEKGGVLVLNVRDSINLSGHINVSGRGFRGAVGLNTNQTPFNCSQDNYYYNYLAGDTAARKGESYATLSDQRIFGKGKLAGAGGGGNSHNSGGGGGANGGLGGQGGYQLQACTSGTFDNGGRGGVSHAYSNLTNKIFMGSGGGAGHVNNPPRFTGSGGNGGGIAIIRGATLINNGYTIQSNGQEAVACTLPGSGCHEGMGGGGAGGTLLLDVSNFVNNLDLEAKGGAGGNMTDGVNGLLGPGGGGGGGICWFKSASVPAGLNPYLNGGVNGTCINYANNPWGAVPGTAGNNLFTLNLPFSSTPFSANIDSVRIQDSITGCQSFNFNGFGYTNNAPIQSWHWDFGDNTSANTQNTSHTYSSTGTFQVQLIVTDLNGCKDSIIKLVTVANIPTSSTTNLAICSNQSPYTWNGQSYSNSGTYNVTLTSTNGCDSIATLNLTINQPSISTNNISICNNQLPYTWNGQTISSGGTYTATLVNANGCDSTATLNLVINQTSSSLTNINTCASSLPLSWNGQTISTGGTYTANLINSAGCDSTASLNLSVLPNGSSQTNVSICSSQAPYTWNGQSYNNSGTYNVTLTGTNGCDSIANLNLTVNPVRTSTTQVAICNGQLPYTWNGQSYNSPGNYTVTLTGSNGCDSIATLALSIGIAATTQENLQRCRAQLPLNWNGQVLTSPGTYSATLSTSAGCDSVVNLTLTVFNDPIVSSIGDSSICPGQSITLETQGAVSYQWSPTTGLSNPNASNPLFTGTSSQQYVVTGTDANGCRGTDTLNIEVKTLAGLQVPPDAGICRKDSARLNGNNGAAYTYQWTPVSGLSNPNIENPMASPETTQVYQVSITDSICGISNNFSVRVTVWDLPNVQASKSNDITCRQRQSRLRAQGASQYSWEPATALNQTNISNPVANPSNQTTYVVTGTDTNGCSNQDSVTIKVLTSPAAYGIPTAFTPNNDGLNDCFGVRYWGDTRDFQLIIWNRYGEKVFETKQSGDCWDGTYKGSPADPGTYVYLVEGITGCGKLRKKNTVVLIR